MLPWVTSLRGVGASSSIIIPQHICIVNIEFRLGEAIWIKLIKNYYLDEVILIVIIKVLELVVRPRFNLTGGGDSLAIFLYKLVSGKATGR